MKIKLRRKINEIKKKVKNLGGNVLAEETLNEDSVILYNRNPGKVVFLGIFPEKSDFKAYSVNINKWIWAEKEGFSRDEIVEKLRDDIFSPIKMKELPESLL